MHEFGFQVSDEADRVGRPTDVEVLLAPSLRNSARRDSFTYDVRGGIGGTPGEISEIFQGVCGRQGVPNMQCFCILHI